MRRRTPLVVLGLLALASSACGGGGEKKAGAATAPTSTATEVTQGKATEVSQGKVAPLAPLTGRPDESEVVTARPSLAIKIDNSPKARPQAGLDVADVVFEEMVEGGQTRFIAVFQSAAPDEVGPVRSVRPMDPNIVSSLGGIIGYSGGIPEFVKLMRNAAGVQDLNFDNLPKAYHRASGKSAPHNLFVSPSALWAAADASHSAPPPALFAFRGAGEAFGESDATSVKIPFSPGVVSVYDWDAATGSWKRSQSGAPHVAASGAQISPENVIVQFVSTQALRYRDQSGSPVMESIVVGEGEAWFFSGGRLTKGRWSKSDAGSVSTYTDATGAPVRLATGKTWIHYAPVGSNVAVGAPAPAG